MWPRIGDDNTSAADADGASQAPVADEGDLPDAMSEPVGDDGIADWAETDWDEAPAPRRGSTLASALIVLTAIGWTAFIGWTSWRSGFAVADPAAWISAIVAACVPLILLAALYLIIQRSSTAEAHRYGILMHDLDRKTAALEVKLAGVNDYLAAAHGQMRDEGERLSTASLAIGGNIIEASDRIAAVMAQTVGASERVESSSRAAFERAEGLLAGLPRVDAVAAQLTERLQQAGLAAHQHGSALQAQIAALQETAETSGAALTETTTGLTGQIEQLDRDSDALAQRIGSSRADMLAAIHESLSQAETAMEQARDQARGEVAALVADAEAARDRLVLASEGMAENARERFAECDDVVASIGAQLDGQATQADAIVAGLGQAIAQSGEAMTALDSEWTSTLDRLGRAIGDLSGQAETMTHRLGEGDAAAQALVSRAEDLMVALDSVAREIDETMPRSFARLDGKVGESTALVSELVPMIESVEAIGTAALENIREAGQLLSDHGSEAERQRAALFELARANSKSMSDLKTLLADIEKSSNAVVDESAPRLVEAMVRVKESAGQAVAHARSALAGVIDDAAERLRATAEQGLSESIASGVEDRIAEIATVAERAVEASRAATDQLMRQMITISETSAAIEARVADARQAVSEADTENLSRHVALLTESLKSTAIDINKILSNEVTDTAWDAYLKGDRGVFTRRAVRLLDASEAREILAYYENDADFRDYVNRYIHDFEAMLRTMLDTRDGQAVSVTLLSSDMGKLYVALAQAIERLRG